MEQYFYSDKFKQIYTGQMCPGDRPATAAEIAAFEKEQKRALILAEIAEIEAEQTKRLEREAALGVEGSAAALLDIETRIARKRAELADMEGE